MRKFIPNILTLSNLMSGCIGVVFAFTADLRLASMMIFVSLIFDYLDGFAARVLRVKSDIGKELDSLADLVSFGLVPSLIAYNLLIRYEIRFLLYFPFLIAVFSAYRLAKFNIDERQATEFIGLPTPANAIFWSAFPLIISSNGESRWHEWLSSLFSSLEFIVVSIAVTSFLLVAGIRLFSLKFAHYGFTENAHRYIFLIISAAGFAILNYHSIPFIIFLYLLISVIHNTVSKRHEIHSGN